MSRSDGNPTWQPDWFTPERVDTVIVAFVDIYGRLLGKRMTHDFFVNDTVKSGIHACNYLLAADMDMNLRVKEFLDFQRHGAAGKDAEPGTPDDLKNPLDRIAVAQPGEFELLNALVNTLPPEGVRRPPQGRVGRSSCRASSLLHRREWPTPY